ncbi:MAG: tetratricopeptide repeat protein [Gemmatimonadetes bacterium]|nr:tetratricopeptide repeat protein [Gemmatimonadota bacterium]
MRHLRTSRVADRDRTIAELLGADGGLEGAPVPLHADEGFSLRPLAAALPGDDVVVTDPLGEGTEIDHLYRRAREQVQRGRPAEAVITYRQLLELDGKHRSARVELAQLLEGSGDLEGAADQLTAALKGDPDAADLLIQRGALLGQLKLYVEAEADLRRVLRKEAQSAPALFHLGVVQVRKGLPSEGAPTLRRALEADPANVAAWYALGEALMGLRDLVGAEGALRRALELAPSHSRACHLLGRVLDRLGRTDEAAVMYQRARENTR